MYTRNLSLIIILAVLISFNTLAFADDYTDSSDYQFTFRNGITWGMTPIEVLKQEDPSVLDELDDADSLNYMIHHYYNTTFIPFYHPDVSVYHAYSLEYHFVDNELAACSYKFENIVLDYDFLDYALELKYGEGRKAYKADVYRFLSFISNEYDAALFSHDYDGRMAYRILEDNTVILIIESVDERLTDILYGNPKYVLSGSLTDGL